MLIGVVVISTYTKVSLMLPLHGDARPLILDIILNPWKPLVCFPSLPFCHLENFV